MENRTRELVVTSGKGGTGTADVRQLWANVLETLRSPNVTATTASN